MTINTITSDDDELFKDDKIIQTIRNLKKINKVTEVE